MAAQLWAIDKAHSGDLTIRGLTRAVTAEVEQGGKAGSPWGNQRVAFKSKLIIEREEFALKWNQALETGGILVGKQVEIDLVLQAFAPTAPSTARGSRP